jgi:hypothetical protein
MSLRWGPLQKIQDFKSLIILGTLNGFPEDPVVVLQPLWALMNASLHWARIQEVQSDSQLPVVV